MFLHDQLATTISTDRQARFRRAARRQRLVSRNKVPPADASSPPAVLAVSWTPGADSLPSPQHVHCAA